MSAVENLKSANRQFFTGKCNDSNHPSGIRQNFSLLDFIDCSLRANEFDEVVSLIEHLKEYFGYDFFGIGVLTKNTLGPNFYHFYNDCPWNNYYIENNLLLKDPFVQHCIKNTSPLIWNYNNTPATPKDQDIFHLASDFSLKNTVTLPLGAAHGYLAGIKFNTIDNELSAFDVEYTLPTLISSCRYIYEAIQRIDRSGTKVTQTLTKREKEVLSWSALGKNAWETSMILNISENTVHTYLKRIYKKLEVHNRQHAVAKALSLNIITMQ